MLVAPASNTGDVLSRNTCAYSTQLKRPICRQQSQTPPSMCELQEVFPSKTNSINTGNNVLGVVASDIDGVP